MLNTYVSHSLNYILRVRRLGILLREGAVTLSAVAMNMLYRGYYLVVVLAAEITSGNNSKYRVTLRLHC